MKWPRRKPPQLTINVAGKHVTFACLGYLVLRDATVRIDRLDPSGVEISVLPKMTEEELRADTDRQTRIRYGLPSAPGVR